MNDLLSEITTFRTKIEYSLAGRKKASYRSDWSLSEAMHNIPDERSRYDYFLWKFKRKLPQQLRSHREYFQESRRGFGEDAFHAMWEQIIVDFKPRSMLEIGVYRGQTISLWALIAKLLDLEINIWGVSPLTSAGDEVSEYIEIDYEQDIVESFKALGLGEPQLVRGLSQDPGSVEFIRSIPWDVIYVDGSHDYADVTSDVELCFSALVDGGLMVLDDASKYSGYKPRGFSFEGHPGPSRVANELLHNPNWDFVGACGHNRIFRKITSPQ